MERILKIIEIIKKTMYDVILENNLTYLGEDVSNLFQVYSADFCGILLSYFPSSTIMMNKNYINCGILINGYIYDVTGIRKDVNNFHVANTEEINFIQKGFSQLSDDVIGKLIEKLEDNLVDKNYAFCLRKNKESIT